MCTEHFRTGKSEMEPWLWLLTPCWSARHVSCCGLMVKSLVVVVGLIKTRCKSLIVVLSGNDAVKLVQSAWKVL